jgi:putative peptide-modifying radical SAM enzyme
MYFILYLTERCNLECSYCETRTSRSERTQDIRYALDDLIAFLRQDPELGLQFYGGEPTLRLDLIEKLLDAVPARHVCLQTNAFFLDQLPERLFDRLHVLSVSIDGPAAITDACRGAGVYAEVIRQVTALRARGFPGQIDARMTTSPGVSIYDAVSHFIDDCAFRFDSIYWQLNVLFGAAAWRRDRRFITRWIEQSYKPELTRLIDRWVAELCERGRLIPIVPFAVTVGKILSGERVKAVQCGAGHLAWTVTPEGAIYPCPVLRESPDYCIGTIASVDPRRIEPFKGLRGPCRGCEVIGLCGGRCIYASESMRWGEEGFALICGATKHMIAELERVAPRVDALVRSGRLRLEEYAHLGRDYEVIP